MFRFCAYQNTAMVEMRTWRRHYYFRHAECQNRKKSTDTGEIMAVKVALSMWIHSKQLSKYTDKVLEFFASYFAILSDRLPQLWLRGTPPWMFLPLDIPSEYRPEHVTFGLLCVIFKFPSRIFCRRVPGFATDCPCGVWCRGLTTCLLYVGPPLEF